MNDHLNLERFMAANGPRRLVLTAQLEPVGGLDRFQPAGFPEIGHVIYDAPRGGAGVEPVCIVDSPASMANHLESVCVHSSYDPTPVDALRDLPYLRCVTDAGWPNVRDGERVLVMTSLTEGHRIASTYFLGGTRDGAETTFEKELRDECGILPLGKKAHPSPGAWWSTFRTLFRYDPNSLVHGVLFPQWQIKIARVLTAHLEASGAGRVDRSGVKFDRLGKTTSGQPIFAVDDETASEIRATFIVDLALLRSFGRDGSGLGLAEKQALVALALWKVGQLLGGPFRYRSGCDLECRDLRYRVDRAEEGDLDPNDLAALPVADHLKRAVESFNAAEGEPVAGVTDIYWRAKDLYRTGSGSGQDEQADESPE
jgi:CRISPR-associated protein Csb1